MLGDKKGNKRKQKGDKTDTMTNKNQEGNQKETGGRQDGHNDQQEGRQKETEGTQDGHNDQQEGRQEGNRRETRGTQ